MFTTTAVKGLTPTSGGAMPTAPGLNIVGFSIQISASPAFTNNGSVKRRGRSWYLLPRDFRLK